MACTYDLSKIDAKKKVIIEKGNRPMCDFCDHSMFVDYVDNNEKLIKFEFVKCLISDITYRPLKCSVFECSLQDEEDGQ
jgi:hypothetical protein